tara:strand:- start:1280 stop:1741 length:462 start_codon:yes stop_codon:yes gene_type:complete
MFFISHRGNLNGSNKREENKIEYINKALKQNFDVEIDLWYINKNFFLGHDKPQYKVDRKFLKNKKFWIHAKNLDCFYKLSRSNLNYFWHENDKVILTSKGFFWNFPGTKLYKKNSIYVLPENHKKFDTSLGYVGICSDYIIKYKKKIQNIEKK